jgi:hypothetical protein
MDLSQLDLSADEIRYIRQEAVEGKATEAVMKFNKDKNPKHLANFFRMFPDRRAIVLDGICIYRADIEKE